MSTAGTNKIAILIGLQTLFNTVDEFKDEVYISYRTQTAAQSHILIHLYQDNPVGETTDEDGHNLAFNIVIRNKSNLPVNDAETELTEFVELVGKVEDLIKSNRYNASVWENLEVDRIVYTFRAGQQFVQYNALMRLIAKAQW